MKIYSINLDKDKDNWHKIDKLNMKYNLNILRLPGVDGKELLDTNCHDDIKNLVTKNYIDKSDPEKVGKMLSHGRMWKKIVKNDLNNVMVIHDNVDFVGNKEDFNDTLDKIMNDLPVNYDLIFIGNDGICKDGEHQFKVNVCDSYNYLYNIPVWSNDISAYIISNKGARKLLSYMFPLMDDLDVQIGNLMRDNKILAYSTKYPLSKKKHSKTKGGLLKDLKKITKIDIYLPDEDNINKIGMILVALFILFMLFGKDTEYGKMIIYNFNMLVNNIQNQLQQLRYNFFR